MWQVPRLWEGGECWILGGGPSLTEQFEIPKNVVQSVIEGKALPNVYSPYMSAIHNKHVIGINMSYKFGDWVDIVFFGDNGFFLREKNELAAFPGIKVTSHPQCEKYAWIKYTGRDTRHTKGISSNPKMISWNANSGAASISIAAHLGVKKIILVGFDMKLDDVGKQHWHDLYHRMENLKLPQPKNKKPNGLPFNRHLLGFPEIAKDAKKMNIEIINACPNSAIQEFPKVNVKDLIMLKELV
jgi:hypothetical protein